MAQELETQTFFERARIWINAHRPCTQAIEAVNENIKATHDLRETVQRFDTTIQRMEPYLERIAQGMHAEERNTGNE